MLSTASLHGCGVAVRLSQIHTYAFYNSQTNSRLFVYFHSQPLTHRPFFFLSLHRQGGYSAYFFGESIIIDIVCMYGKHNTRTESGQDVVVPNQQPTSRVLYNSRSEKCCCYLLVCVVASSLTRSFFSHLTRRHNISFFCGSRMNTYGKEGNAQIEPSAAAATLAAYIDMERELLPPKNIRK